MKKLITILAALAVSTAFVTAADEEKKPDAAKPDAAAAKPAAKADAKPGEKKAAVSPEERFKKLDKDGDGFISLEEFKAGVGAKDPAKAEEIFKKKDANNDGKLSPEEFAGPAKKAK